MGCSQCHQQALRFPDASPPAADQPARSASSCHIPAHLSVITLGAITASSCLGPIRVRLPNPERLQRLSLDKKPEWAGRPSQVVFPLHPPIDLYGGLAERRDAPPATSVAQRVDAIRNGAGARHWSSAAAAEISLARAAIGAVWRRDPFVRAAAPRQVRLFARPIESAGGAAPG